MTLFHLQDGPCSLSLYHLLAPHMERRYRIKVFCFEPGMRFALGAHFEFGHLPDWFVSLHVAWWDIHVGRWGCPKRKEVSNVSP